MREAMALSGEAGDPSRICKRVTVLLCAAAHLVVTLYVLRVLVGSSSSSSQGSPSSSPPWSDFLLDLNPYRLQGGELKRLQEKDRKAAIQFRRQSTPLQLLRRVKEIETEVAMDIHGQAPANVVEKTEQEELQEQVELETE